jgi:diadenosine tetraphosphate (Ap4A) HIT family hydrolase
MKYTDFLKTLKKCPFCDTKKSRILIENNKAFLTYALAPYHKYHLLVVPKRHIESIKDLTLDENVCVMALIATSIKALSNIGHNDCTVLVRDGQALGKSIKHHLHCNIIPGGEIEDVSINAKVRKLLSKKEEKSLIQELKNTIKKG